MIVVIVIVSSGNSPVGGKNGGGGKNNPPPSGKSIELTGAKDYDPQGDGKENPELVEEAVDGDPATAWSTEHYDTEDFSGTKTGPDPGVGLYVTAAAAATPKTMVVESPTPGWDAQIYAAAAGPPGEVSEWGEPVGEVNGAEKTENVSLHLPGAAKYFLIWLTKASPAADQEGRYQVEIGNVKLIE